MKLSPLLLLASTALSLPLDLLARDAVPGGPDWKVKRDAVPGGPDWKA